MSINARQIKVLLAQWQMVYTFLYNGALLGVMLAFESEQRILLNQFFILTLFFVSRLCGNLRPI